MITTRITRIVREHLCTGDKPLSSSSRLVEDLGADSLDQVELAFVIEEEFSIELTDDETDGCTTIGNWIDLVAQKTGEPT